MYVTTFSHQSCYDQAFLQIKIKYSLKFRMAIQILLIEDDEINRFIFKKIASQMSRPVDVITCDNGQSAIDYLISYKDTTEKLPDIIFIDLNMPVMTGWKFIEELSRQNISKPMRKYILTSSISPDDMERYELVVPKLEAYIVKPITKDKLIEIMDRATPFE